LQISSLESHGILTLEQDYTIYPRFQQSIGFTQRGCRLNCSFCVVPQKEGKVKVRTFPKDVLDAFRKAND
jgi:tRNA A37 methylthiotransferase MiaB